MKKAMIMGLFLLPVAAFAVPRVDQNDVTFTQDPTSHRVTITYVLTGEPGVVTVDIQTNYLDGTETRWASIGDENLHRFAGAVNRVVSDLDVVSTITWDPVKSWPGHTISAGVRAVVNAWALAAPPDYMVVSLSVPSNVCYYTSEAALPLPITNNHYRTEEMVFRKIPAAGIRWRMGAPSSESTDASEIPHYVTFTNDYYMGVFEVTKDQYLTIKTTLPTAYADDAYGDHARRPIANVTFGEIRGSSSTYNWPAVRGVSSVSFVGRFSLFAGPEFDLPTDAQWEYACRAGCGAAQYYVLGNGLAITDIAWMADNAEGHSHVVGTRRANAWGLYDMLGNVREWCLDWYETGAAYSDGSDVVDPPGPASSSAGSRARRGESWAISATNVRCARRLGYDPLSTHESIGFRVCCPAVAK